MISIRGILRCISGRGSYHGGKYRPHTSVDRILILGYKPIYRYDHDGYQDPFYVTPTQDAFREGMYSSWGERMTEEQARDARKKKVSMEYQDDMNSYIEILKMNGFEMIKKKL